MGLGGAPERPGQEPEGEGPCQGGDRGTGLCSEVQERPACWGVEGGAWQEWRGHGLEPHSCPTGPVLKGEAEGETAPPKALTASGSPAPGAGVDGKGA